MTCTKALTGKSIVRGFTSERQCWRKVKVKDTFLGALPTSQESSPHPSPPPQYPQPPTVLQSRLANPYLQLENTNSPISKAERISTSNKQQTAQPMSRPVYLCEEHRKQRILIQVTGAPDEDEATVEERRVKSTERLLMPDVASSSCRSFTSEGTQTEARGKKRGERKEDRAREKEERRRQKEVEEAEQYRKLSVQEAAYRKLSQQYEEQLNYGMDSMSLDSGEDSK